MLRIFCLTVLFAASAVSQETGSPEILLTFTSRREVMGTPVELTPDGDLVYRQGSVLRSAPIDTVAKLDFGHPERISPPASGKVVLRHGGQLTATALGFAGDTFTLRTSLGELTLDRIHARTVHLGTVNESQRPELPQEKGDLLLWKDADKNILVFSVGRLSAIDSEAVTLTRMAGGTIRIPRPSALTLVLLQDGGDSGERYTGWFARVNLSQGDRLTGILRSVQDTEVSVFSRALGLLRIPRKLLSTITFAANARLSSGNIVLCEQSAVREFDRTGKELWRYTDGIIAPQSARKLENGNYLIANTSRQQVIEVKPIERQRGEIVWALEGIQMPMDARRLDNGNTLVSERLSNRVVEYSYDKKEPVWICGLVQEPRSAQRLDNGNTLITSCRPLPLVEVGPKGDDRLWKPKFNKLRADLAERLPDGNTLIVDIQRGIVAEVDHDPNEPKVLWKKDGLTKPMGALRMDDGNTLVVEQDPSRPRIVDFDVTGREVGVIERLQFPQGLSTY